MKALRRQQIQWEPGWKGLRSTLLVAFLGAIAFAINASGACGCADGYCYEDVVIASAEIPAVNGTYVYTRIYDSRPHFGPWLGDHRVWHSSGGDWYIENGGAVAYYITSASSTPPSTGWKKWDPQGEASILTLSGGTACASPTTATITLDNPDPSVTGQAYTVSVSVSAVGWGTPTGTVSVHDWNGNSGVITLSGGTGSCTISGAAAGAGNITASYSGDASHNPSSDTEPHTVDKGSTATTITADTPDPSAQGAAYTVSVTVVVVAPAVGAPTGTVNVDDGSGNTGTITLAGGSGSCTISGTLDGSHTLTASYVGDANFNGSSDTEPHTVDGIAPSVDAVTVVTGLTVDVEFDEEMGSGVTTASNYAVSGSGSGTLAVNPNTVVLKGGTMSTYTLTWASGEMFDGGDITVTVSNAEDLVGNVVDPGGDSGTDSGGAIGVAPGVTIDQAGAQADPTNGSPIDFTVVFSETVTGFATGDVTVGGTANPTTGTVAGGGTTYNVAVSGMTDEGTVTASIGAGVAQDAAGNTNQASTSTNNSVTYDTLNPTVVSITPSDTLISDADAGTFTVIVVYGETMDATGTNDPTVTFTPGVGSTLGFVGDAWSTTANANDTYTATYSVSDAGVTVDDVGIGVDGAKDAAGNPQVAGGAPNAFDIDTENPTVTSITPSDPLISDADTGVGKTFTVTVVYGETMDATGTNDPSIAFSPAVGTTLAFASDGWSTTTNSNDTYTAVYNVTDAGVTEDDVDIEVDGAKDWAGGNAQVTGDALDAFDIDTENPYVDTIDVSDTLISDADTGAGKTFSVYVEFSESMDTGTAPTVAFTPSVASTLTFSSASWWPQSDPNDSYTATYSVADTGVTIKAIRVGVGGARDAAGNPQAPDPENRDNVFDIDTQNPVFGTFTVGGGAVDGNCTIAAAFAARATDTYGIAVGDIVVDDVTIPTGNATEGASSITKRTQVDPNTADVEGTVAVSDLTSCPARVRVVLEATDTAGNTTTAGVTGDDITDTTAPVVDGLDLPNTAQLVDGTCSRTIDYTATVTDNCCIDASNVSATVTLLTGNATLSASAAITNTGGAVPPAPNDTVSVSGSFAVSNLTSCPATVRVTIAATDCCGNVATTMTLTDTVEIIDDTDPTWDHAPPLPQDETFECDGNGNVAQIQAWLAQASASDNCTVILTNDYPRGTPPDDPNTGWICASSPDPDRLLPGCNSAGYGPGAPYLCVGGCCQNTPCVDCCTGTGAALVTFTATDQCDNTITHTATVKVVDTTPPNAVEDHETIREDTPTWLEVLANDSDLCDGNLTITDVTQAPRYGRAPIMGCVIRYAPNQGYLGPDRFVYEVSDCSGNVGTASVYVNVVAKNVLEDVFAATCAGQPVAFALRASDPYLGGDDYDDFVFRILDAPVGGVIAGDFGDIEITESLDVGQKTGTVELAYSPLPGFIGLETLRVELEDPFGVRTVGQLSIAVSDCDGTAVTIPFAIEHGQTLTLLIPLPEATPDEVTGWVSGVLLAVSNPLSGLTTVIDPTVVQQILTTEWNEGGGHYELRLDTGPLGPGTYRLTIPLETGERVTLTLVVEEVR